MLAKMEVIIFVHFIEHERMKREMSSLGEDFTDCCLYEIQKIRFFQIEEQLS